MLRVAMARVLPDVDHADPVMGVEDGHNVVRTVGQPAVERCSIARMERIEHERREREVVGQVARTCEVERESPVGVDLDEDLEAVRPCASGEVGEERARLRGHEG